MSGSRAGASATDWCLPKYRSCAACTAGVSTNCMNFVAMRGSVHTSREFPNRDLPGASLLPTSHGKARPHFFGMMNRKKRHQSCGRAGEFDRMPLAGNGAIWISPRRARSTRRRFNGEDMQGRPHLRTLCALRSSSRVTAMPRGAGAGQSSGSSNSAGNAVSVGISSRFRSSVCAARLASFLSVIW